MVSRGIMMEQLVDNTSILRFIVYKSLDFDDLFDYTRLDKKQVSSRARSWKSEYEIALLRLEFDNAPIFK